VAADYALANFGSTRFVDSDILISGITTGAYNDFTLNASGIANIAKTGISKFGYRHAVDIDNSAPTWGSGADSYFTASFSDTGSNQPKLDVTFTRAGNILWWY